MFKKKEWDELKEIGSREQSFDWDIPSGYILFGTYGMKICKRIKGRWMTKIVNDWRAKDYQTVNAEIKSQEWEDDNGGLVK